jgi:hypothetical protein
MGQEAVEATAAAKTNNAFSFSNSMKNSSDQLLHKQLKICFGVSAVHLTAPLLSSSLFILP